MCGVQLLCERLWRLQCEGGDRGCGDALDWKETIRLREIAFIWVFE